jgi:hypothetical protein
VANKRQKKGQYVDTAPDRRPGGDKCNAASTSAPQTQRNAPYPAAQLFKPRPLSNEIGEQNKNKSTKISPANNLVISQLTEMMTRIPLFCQICI